MSSAAHLLGLWVQILLCVASAMGLSLNKGSPAKCVCVCVCLNVIGHNNNHLHLQWVGTRGRDEKNLRIQMNSININSYTKCSLT